MSLNSIQIYFLKSNIPLLYKIHINIFTKKVKNWIMTDKNAFYRLNFLIDKYFWIFECPKFISFINLITYMLQFTENHFHFSFVSIQNRDKCSFSFVPKI